MGLDAVELIMLVEDRFEIQIPDNEAEQIATVGQLLDYVIEKLNADPNKVDLSQDEIKEIIIDFIHNITGVSKSEITLDSTFTNDLGMD